MLLKIEEISEIGRFSTLDHRAQNFGDFTLIYARNGYGKSTVCSVIRSAAEQDPLIISARRRLGATAASRVDMQWKASATRFVSGGWSAQPSDVHIFDGEYVSRNLHVAESVTRSNKRNLVTVIFGERGVELARAISELDSEQRTLQPHQVASEKAIKLAHPVITDVSSFVTVTTPEDIEIKLVSAEKRIELARLSVAVKEKRDPSQVLLLSFAIYETLALQEVESLSEDAGERVRDHVDKHLMKTNGERWLKYGVDHMPGSECPFCTQDTTGIALIDTFRAYFSDAYADLQKRLDDAIGHLTSVLGDDGEKIVRTLEENSQDLDFWEKVCELEVKPKLDTEARQRVKEAMIAIHSLLKEKLARPLSKVTLADRQGTETALTEFAAYQAEIQRCLPVFASARVEASTVSITTAQEILDKLKALKAREMGDTKIEVDAWRLRSERLRAIDIEKKIIQKELKEYVNATVKIKEVAINDLLSQFGATFRISNTKASFVGREANTDYSIAIGSHSVPAGDKDERAPSFNTMLSSGDKFTLALAFFITQVRADSKLGDATVIFDDPFSSQDMLRQWETTSQIRSIAGDASQVIVLSHDPRFLALIEKNCRVRPATFQIQCDDGGRGQIRAWSSSDELKEIYVRQSERIREYANCGQLLPSVTTESLVKDLRPFLESYLRARFPGRFAELKMLDAMAKEIEDAGTSDPMFNSVADLRAINEFGRDSMHGGALIPDPSALRAQCNRVVRIIGSF